MFGNQINKNIYLVHGDATSLVFEDNTFDGYWSVQVLQHIPSFVKAIEEAKRVLKPSGILANYSLNFEYLIEKVYRLFGKKYHVEGMMTDVFYLSRSSDKQKSIIASIFSNSIETRYTEILFHPDFRTQF